MPDDRIHVVSPLPPAGWGEAFAALPLETPDAGGWQRLQAALPRRRSRHWPAWFALAAALAIAAIVPWRSLDRAVPAETTVVVAPDVASIDGAAADAGTHRAAVSTTRAAAPDAAVAAITTETAPRATQVASATRRASRRGDAGPGDTPVATPVAAAIDERQADTQPESGAAGESVADSPADDRVASSAAATGSENTGTPELEALYAESAQLEALVAMARDERVSSGTAAALANRYDAQVAAIDAQLAQPGLAAAQRTQLWRERVASMRQLAGFESIQRLLAAQGERYDAMLVSID